MVANQAQVLLPEDLDPVLVFGPGDQVLRAMQDNLPGVRITTRGGIVTFQGNPGEARMGADLLSELITAARHGNPLSASAVTQALKLMSSQEALPVLHTKRKQIRAKSSGQESYLEAISNNRIVFGIGPAGTGKTYLAMAMAITAFKRNEVGRIILTRPAIEAGEKLGFLPGDLQSKIDPYLRPLYDALYQIMGAESFIKNSEKGLIEVAPLAYMRGRTLDNAFIILDEAQNTTPAQMKMFLTRIGFGSKVVITGDSTQKDLPAGQTSGLDVAVSVVKNLEDISICRLTSRDVVRHPLVQRIVKAYEEYEQKQEQKKSHTRDRKKRGTR